MEGRDANFDGEDESTSEEEEEIECFARDTGIIVSLIRPLKIINISHRRTHPTRSTYISGRRSGHAPDLVPLYRP